jgi:hypothetical protein
MIRPAYGIQAKIYRDMHNSGSESQPRIMSPRPRSPVIYLLLRHSLIDLRHPSPTQLLDGGDIHGAVVEVARQARHALLQEPSVLAKSKNYATVAALI